MDFVISFRIAVLILVSWEAVSLDVQIVNVTCDPNLPVTADVYLQCNGGGRCSFGESASVYGNFYYNGVENYGVQDNVAYLSADLYLMGISFNLCEMQQTSLCDETMVADEANENECPGDGVFQYSITYRLPSAGPEVASWLATGWKGSGVLQMFAAQDESMMIGDCSLDLKTFVTQKDQTLIGTPSAAISAGIALGALAALSLLCCYCYCCRRRRRTKEQPSKTEHADEDASYFQRLEEERSYWSGTSKSNKSKKTEATSKQSVVSDL